MKTKRMSHRGRSQNCSSAPSMFLPQTYASSLSHLSSSSSSSPHCGPVNPAQVFVGGFGYKAREHDLQGFFSQYGRVRQVTLAVDHYGISKGYGFITFVTEEEARNVLVYADRLYFRDKKLSVCQAIYGQALQHNERFREAYYNPAMAPPVSREPVSQTTSTGSIYTYYNGEAYFFNPSLKPPDQHWLAPPSETLQSYWVDNQQLYRYSQPPVPFSPFTLPQQSEYFNRSDRGPVMPPLPFTDTPTENVTFQRSWAYLNPKYRRDVRHSAYHYP